MLTLDPHSLEEVLETILVVGQRAGAAGRATGLVAGLRARLAQIAANVAGRPARLGSSATARKGTQNLLGAYLAMAVFAGLAGCVL